VAACGNAKGIGIRAGACCDPPHDPVRIHELSFFTHSSCRGRTNFPAARDLRGNGRTA